MIELNKEHSIKYNRHILLWLSLFKISNELIYIYWISPLFNYMDLCIDINWPKCLLSWSYLIVLYYIRPKNKNRISTYVFYLMLLLIWIPLFSFMWMNNQSAVYTSWEFLCAFLIAVLVQIKRPMFTISIQRKISHNIFNTLFVLYIVITVYEIVQRGGIDLRALYLQSVYDLRSEYTDLGSINGYLVSWCAKAMCPFFLGYYYLEKKYGRCLICIFLQFLLYLSYGFKAYLASIALMVLIYWISSKNNILEKLTKMLTWISVVAVGIDIIGVTRVLLNFFSFRTLFIPAKNQFHYYLFFSQNEHLHMSGTSIGRLFVKYPYTKPIGFIVESAFTNSGSNGNTGVFSYAFADFGVVGMILVSLIIVIILWLLDDLTLNIEVGAALAILSYWVFTMNDNSIMITMVTGGFLILMILLIMYNFSLDTSESYDEQEKDRI